MNENWQRDDENFVADETSELQVRGNNRVVPDKAVEFIPVYLSEEEAEDTQRFQTYKDVYQKAADPSENLEPLPLLPAFENEGDTLAFDPEFTDVNENINPTEIIGREVVHLFAQECDFEPTPKLSDLDLFIGGQIYWAVKKGVFQKGPIEFMNNLMKRAFNKATTELRSLEHDWRSQVPEPGSAWRYYAWLQLKTGGLGPLWWQMLPQKVQREKPHLLREFVAGASFSHVIPLNSSFAFKSKSAVQQLAQRALRKPFIEGSPQLLQDNEEISVLKADDEEDLQRYINEARTDFYKRNNISQPMGDANLTQEIPLDWDTPSPHDGGEDLRQPVVIVKPFKKRDYWDQDKDPAIYEELLKYHKAVITIFETQNLGQVLHIKVNHEHKDGIHAAYYETVLSNHLGESKGVRGISDDDELRDLLALRDRVDNLGNSEIQNAVEGIVLDKDTLEKTNLLYKSLNQKYKDIYENILTQEELERKNLSWNKILPLIVLEAAGVDGVRVRGGVLKFDKNPLVELDQFSCDMTIKDLSKALLAQDREAVEEILDFYNQDKSNIVGVIKKAIDDAGDDYELMHFLSVVADWLGASRAISGQVLVSVLPADLEMGGIDLKGIGAPAIPSFMDKGMTVYYELDNQGLLKRVVVSKKEKKYKVR